MEKFNFIKATNILDLKFLWAYLDYYSYYNFSNNKYKYNFLIQKSIDIEHGVNICLMTDENYLIPTAVTLQSLKFNRNKNIIYNIFILYTGNKKDFIYDIQLMSSYNFYVKCIPIIFNSYSLKSFGHVTPTTFIKYDIPNIFYNFNKILYLDVDLIILKDLEELYNIDLEDKYLGVVKDPGGYTSRFNFKNRLTAPILDYFNAGVLLFNLDKFRTDGMSRDLWEYSLNNSFSLADQDSFNILCSDQCKFIDFKYNVTQSSLYLCSFEKLKKRYYPNLESDDWENVASIIHFSGGKPWRRPNKMSDLWYKYYRQIPQYYIDKYKLR